MNKKTLIKRCIISDDAAETYPFKESSGDNHPVIRHKSNNKWFALIFELNGKLYINLKSHPIDSAILRDSYEFITPGWHMNKTHWISVEVDKAPDDLLDSLVKTSFELTKK